MSDESEKPDAQFQLRLIADPWPQSNAVCTGVTVRNVPAFFASAGPRADFRFIEFFAAHIRNPNTRAAYYRAVCRFADWCAARRVRMVDLNPVVIAAYVEEMQRHRPEPSVKQALAAIRMLFDWFVTGHVMPFNPASSVRGPRYSLRRGKTPVLDADQARRLLDSIDVGSIVGVRDRALIATMVFTFARVGAVVALKVEDYFQHGKRWAVRLHEKNGKLIEMGVHHNLEAYLDEYIDRAVIRGDRKQALFRRVAKHRHTELTAIPMTRQLVWSIVKRRARAAGLPPEICSHSFRATGITTYLRNGGTLEKAQYMAGHESSRTTSLYDRRQDEITLDDVERIAI
ncbi:MAG: tyrosine-type recombinase/integrase [Phycisphaerales bacterium]|nr:tyrosine-type recombinase/integrase [Phycisphaerales bacterium]